MAPPEQVVDRWEPDPDGSGMIRIPAPEVESEYNPLADPLWGWKPDADGKGYVRMSDSELPPIPRKGKWCEIVGLQQDTDKNGLLMEIVEEHADGIVEVEFDGNTRFQINSHNLAPVKGATELSTYHKEIVMSVNGINCNSCKKSLLEAILPVPGVGACAVSITTKAESGVHPNQVSIKGNVDADKVKQAIETLDKGRNKFTIVAN